MFIEVRDLVKRFGAVPVLQGVNFAMETGEVVAVIGRSGSGKSTFLRCIAGLEENPAGIHYGRRHHAAKWHLGSRWARLIGMVFQGYNLFPHLSVEGNVTLACARFKDSGGRKRMRSQGLRWKGLALLTKPVPTRASFPEGRCNVWLLRGRWR